MYICFLAPLKKIITILLALAVLNFSIAPPCLAEGNEDECETTKCCSDDHEDEPGSSDQQEKETDGQPCKDKNCCVSNILLLDHVTDFSAALPTFVIARNTRHNYALPAYQLADFWQPPRLS